MRPDPTQHRPAPWKQWGDDLEPSAVQQMRDACALPVSVRAALMPDAHPGYGLPIGGVLATENAVIPYAVGVDIACRVRLSVLDIPPEALDTARERKRLVSAIHTETRFGVGAEFKTPREHPVMDLDWSASPVTARLKEPKARPQLGTSGSGNHFVEFGTLTLDRDGLGLRAGAYLALLTHSGSRGVGAAVCDHYSKLAMSLRPELEGPSRRLAWLDLDTDAGREYWLAMELMGAYASANHEIIHREILRALGARALTNVENHHNFAWKERVRTPSGETRELVVHRKGATPAHEGAIGFIPGSMAAPGFVVRGKGSPDALDSAAHGAGRVMSRAEAKRRFTWPQINAYLRERNVELMSAGVDEAPFVYKDIEQVMASQRDLVDVLARFDPRIVKMAPAGERPED